MPRVPRPRPSPLSPLPTTPSPSPGEGSPAGVFLRFSLFLVVLAGCSPSSPGEGGWAGAGEEGRGDEGLGRGTLAPETSLPFNRRRSQEVLMRMKLALPLLALSALTAAYAAHAAPPPTAVEPVKDVLHSVEIVDPYRWLEGSAGLEAPDKALDARVAAWTDAQNAYGRSVLDRIPGRQELEARLRAQGSGGFQGNVRRRGDRLFYERIEGNQQQPVLVVSKSGGVPRVLLDPAAFDPSGLT